MLRVIHRLYLYDSSRVKQEGHAFLLDRSNHPHSNALSSTTSSVPSMPFLASLLFSRLNNFPASPRNCSFLSLILRKEILYLGHHLIKHFPPPLPNLLFKTKAWNGVFMIFHLTLEVLLNQSSYYRQP